MNGWNWAGGGALCTWPRGSRSRPGARAAPGSGTGSSARTRRPPRSRATTAKTPSAACRVPSSTVSACGALQACLAKCDCSDTSCSGACTSNQSILCRGVWPYGEAAHRLRAGQLPERLYDDVVVELGWVDQLERLRDLERFGGGSGTVASLCSSDTDCGAESELRHDGTLRGLCTSRLLLQLRPVRLTVRREHALYQRLPVPRSSCNGAYQGCPGSARSTRISMRLSRRPVRAWLHHEPERHPGHAGTTRTAGAGTSEGPSATRSERSTGHQPVTSLGPFLDHRQVRQRHLDERRLHLHLPGHEQHLRRAEPVLVLRHRPADRRAASVPSTTAGSATP